MLILKRCTYIALFILVVPFTFFANVTWDWWTRLWAKKTWWSVLLFVALTPLYTLCFLAGVSLEWWVSLIE